MRTLIAKWILRNKNCSTCIFDATYAVRGRRVKGGTLRTLYGCAQHRHIPVYWSRDWEEKKVYEIA